MLCHIWTLSVDLHTAKDQLEQWKQIFQVIMRIWPSKQESLTYLRFLMPLKLKALTQILIGEQRHFNNGTQLNGKAFEELSSYSFQTQSRAKRPLSARLTHVHAPTVDDTGCDLRVARETWEITSLSQRQQLLLTWPWNHREKTHTRRHTHTQFVVINVSLKQNLDSIYSWWNMQCLLFSSDANLS